MQVFVKFPSGTIPVDASLDSSVLDVVEQAGLSCKPPIVVVVKMLGKVTLGIAGRPIFNLAVTLRDLNVQNDSTFRVEFGLRDGGFVADAIHEKLQAFLRSAPAELGSDEITFIGIGSCDHDHGDASVKRQQCPDSLLNFCIQNRVDLNIVLVDPDFGEGGSSSRQIYDFPGWLPLSNEDDGKTRRFMYAPATAARACDIWLTVFSTKIAEYTGSLVGRGMVIAGVPVKEIFSTVLGPNACLICGNFYEEHTDPSQYFTLGNWEVLECAGFACNP